MFGFLFRKKNDLASILLTTQRRIFDVYSVTDPTDAQKIKASVYLCWAGMAVINDMEAKAVEKIGSRDNHLRNVIKGAIDRLVDETSTLLEPLEVHVNELASNPGQLERILSGFPVPVQEATKVNGLAACGAMFTSMGEEQMTNMLNNSQGPFGIPGYAGIVITKEVFGESKSVSFVEINTVLLEFFAHLIDNIKP